MTIEMIGKKCGMTRVFDEEGAATPVTVIHIAPNRISQVKSVERDGYSAVQVTAGNKKSSRVNKPSAGHFSKATVEPGAKTREFRVEDTAEFEAGKEITLATYQQGQKVDVIGMSKGKGFAGTIKRYNFSMQDATHGNSISHRKLGSTGQCQDPGRVFKGKKMPGRMGHERVTIQNLEVVKVDEENNLLLVKGAVPGPRDGDVIVKSAVKAAS